MKERIQNGQIVDGDHTKGGSNTTSLQVTGNQLPYRDVFVLKMLWGGIHVYV
jgi:hypothetical protein